MDNSKSPEKNADVIIAKRKELANAYLRLFGSNDGQRVQLDLNERFLMNHVPEGSNHDYWSGARMVVVYIMSQQAEGNT